MAAWLRSTVASTGQQALLTIFNEGDPTEFRLMYLCELGEDEGGSGYPGDSAGAGGDVLEDGPALGEQGEPALCAAAQFA